MRTKLSSIIVGLGLMLALAGSAWGYTFITNNGQPVKWNSGNINFTIIADNSTVLFDGYTLAGSIQQAMQLWNARIAAVQFAPTINPGGSAGDGNHANEVIFSDHVFDQSFDDPNILAVTTDWRIGSQRTEADIVFNTAWTWDSYGGGLFTEIDVQRVALHELGHVLGLDHPDQASPPQSVTAIMNASVSNLDRLQQDDISGGQALYGGSGGVTAPANDAFANAVTITLSGNSAQATGTNLYATKESGEPNHAGEVSGTSVWWKWTAPANGSMTITTAGSNFDTLLGVYTGSAVSALTTIAANDEAPSGGTHTSAVTFNATGGTTYYIAVDGWDYDSGSVTLNLNFTPTGGSGLMRVTMVGLIDYIDDAGAYLPSKGARRGDPFTISAIYDPTITSSPPAIAGMYPIDFSTAATVSFSGLIYTMPGFRATVVNNLVYNGGPGGLTTVDGHILQGTVPASTDLNALDFTTTLYSSNTNLVGSASSYTLQLAQPSDYNFLSFFRLQGYDRINPYPGYLFNVSGPITYISVTSASAPQTAPSITAQPANQTPTQGQPATFSVSASGVPSPVLQWQRLPAGTNAWVNLTDGGNYSGVHTNTLTVSGTSASMSGDQFRCVALSTSGGAASNAALLTVAGTVPAVINHPVDQTVTLGQIAHFTVTVAGNPVPTYQWQRQGSGTSTWTNVSDGASYSGASTAILTINTAIALQGDQFRCIATNNQGSVTSNPGRLILLNGVPAVIAAESGSNHTVFLGSNGELWGMGPNGFGELGLGASVSNPYSQSFITAGATGIAAGNATSFYIKPDSTLWGTGFAGFGQFGNGTTPQAYRSPIQVASSAVQVAASGDFTMHLKNDQTLWACGRNSRGQLGTGDTGQRNTWELVGTNVIWVATGPEHTLFIKSDRSLWAVGDNSTGELGDGTLTERHVPVLVATNVIKAFAGYYVSYFIKADNTLWGMGSNGGGQLGDNSTTDRHSPVFIANNVSYVSSALNGSHTLFITTDASLWGMGGNGVGQLGTGPAITINQVPVLIANNVVAASTGGGFSTFAKSDGTYWGMGRSTSQDELAIPGFADYFFPRLISTGSMVGPGMPSSVAAVYGMAGDGVNVTWTPVPGAASYEVWRNTGNDSAGATRIAANVTIPLYWDSNTVNSTNYFYWIKAVNVAGASSFSGPAVTMNVPPAIVTQPTDRTVYATYGTQFSVSASGVPTPTYKWQYLPAGGTTWGDLSEGGHYSGVTTANLQILGFDFSMTGDQFRFVATNIAGTATSNAATVTVVAPPPSIDSGPSNQTVALNSPLTLSVTASSLAPISYQWRKNGVNISGATAATYTVPSAQLSDAGNYFVVVSNSTGSSFSATVTVVVATLPVITTQPATQAVTVGQSVSFSVVATSAAPLSYVWRKNGTPIGGATAATYTIASTQLTDAADYSVVVTNVAGSATSNAATLTVNVAPPVITVQPANQVITQGATANFSITATGNPAPTYQWQVLPVGGSWSNTANGATYAGSQTATLTVSGALAAVNSGDQYRCVATNAGGSVTSNAASLTVVLNPGPIAVAAGGTFTTYLSFDGSLYGTGTNTDGQLGDGTTTNRTAPVALATGVAAMAAGTDHQLLLKADGSLWVNGYNPFGALGTNDTASRSTPVQIATGVATIAAGHRHSLFIKTDGTLWAMGWNSTGQLGDGTTTNRLTPVQVATHVIAVAGGVSHSLFLKSDGTAWAMGDNSLGQLGDGTTTNRLTPVQIATGVASISAGGYFNLLLKTDASLWAVGFNGFGELGDGTTTNRLTPVQVATGVRAMSGGFHHSMYLKTDGTLWSVGYNDFGQIGDGSTTSRSVPFQLATGVTGLSAGRYQGAFIKSDGSLWVVGGNNFGQLGDSTTTNRLTPVQLTTGTVSLAALVTNLTATELVNSDRITLTWNAALGATYYEVWRSTTAQSSDAVRIATRVPGTFFEDVTAATGVVYQYWVRSANGAGVTGFGASDAGSFGAILVAPAITVPPASQTVNVGANVTFSVTAGGTAPFTYQWRKGGNGLTNGGIVSGATTATLTLTGVQTADAGSYDVIVTNAAGGITSAAATLTVNQLGQTITFNALSDTPYTPVPFALSATASSGLAVSFSVVSGPASISGGNITLTGVGAVTIRAAQAGNATYASAANVDRSFNVTKAPATVTLASLAATYDGTAKSATATTNPAALAVVFTYDGSATAPTNAGSYAVVGAINEANYQGSASGTLVIAKAAQAITFAGPASQTYSPVPITLSATADSGLTVAFSIVSGPATVSGNSLTLTGAGLVTVRADQAGDSNHLAAPSVDRSFNSNKLGQTISFAAPADCVYTTTPFNLSATADSGLPVAFSIVSGPATLSGNALTITGVGTITVRAAQAGNSLYNPAANVDRSFVVSKAPATVTLAGLTATYDGTAKSATATTNPAALAVDFTYDGSAAVPTNAGSYAVIGTINEANYQGSANGTLVIAKADQTIAFTGPANQPYSATPITLSATASSGLTVTFSVVSGPATVSGTTLTLTGAGIVTVRAAQAGDANRNAAPDVDSAFTVLANLDSWLQAKFTPAELADPNISGPNAVYGQDGLPNLVKYALGLEPKQNITTGLPSVGTAGTDWVYTYTRPTDITDVTYDVEVSTDLVNWTDAGVIHELVSSDGTTDTWHGRYPHASATNVFFRLKVTQ